MDAFAEKIILLELQREYIDICRTYKLNLKPVQVVLFNSTAKWGEYDHAARTLSLSRRLVLEQPWRNVIGVLKHEIAHQIVSEKHQNRLHILLPHGEEFKQACALLKLSLLFQSSRLELVDENINFENLDESLEDTTLIEKVKKLMSLATSENEHEAKLAAAKVRELYLKYNLEKIGLNQSEKYDRLIVSLEQKNVSLFDKKVISLLTDYYFVKTILIREFNVKKMKTESAIELMGLRENLKMAEYVFQFLRQACQSALIVKAKSLQRKLSLKEKESFRIGFIDGFADSLKRDQISTMPSLKYTDAELKKQKHLLKIEDTRLDEFMNACYPRIRQLKSTSRQLVSDHYSHGREAGQKTKISQPIEKKTANKAISNFMEMK